MGFELGAKAHPELISYGVVIDAEREYAEARISHAVYTRSYLYGIGEAKGEMRRRMLDLRNAEN